MVPGDTVVTQAVKVVHLGLDFKGSFLSSFPLLTAFSSFTLATFYILHYFLTLSFMLISLSLFWGSAIIVNAVESLYCVLSKLLFHLYRCGHNLTKNIL
jgi:hypothetical protein